MKKSAILAAVLVLATSSAFAYENSYAGYSVKDGDPFFKGGSQRTYVYTNMDSKFIQNSRTAKKSGQAAVNIVKFYNADEMEKVVGEKFSTTYFDAEYNKLALLKRSELNLKTVPTPLLDEERYQAIESIAASDLDLDKNFFKNALEKVKPVYSIGKIGKYNAITKSYLYKQDNELVSAKESLLSVNDKLYSLSSVYVDSEIFAPKKEEKAVSDAADMKTTSKKEVLDIEAVEESTLSAKTISTLNKAHEALIKSFKTFTPQGEQSPVSYTDPSAGKNMVLPDDWFYSQFNLQLNKRSNVTITMSASLPEVLKVVEHTDYDKLLQARAEDAKATKSDQTDADTFMVGTVNDPLLAGAVLGMPHVKLAHAYTTEIKNTMPYWNSSLVTVSFKDDGSSGLGEALAEPMTTKLAVDSFLRDGLKRLKDFSANDDFISLTDYAYTLDCDKEKIVANLDLKQKFFQEYPMHSKIYVGANANTAVMTFFLKKADYTPESLLEKQLMEWQF